MNGDTRAQSPPEDERAENLGLLVLEGALFPAHSACPPQGENRAQYSGTYGLRDSASFLVSAGPEGE